VSIFRVKNFKNRCRVCITERFFNFFRRI